MDGINEKFDMVISGINLALDRELHHLPSGCQLAAAPAISNDFVGYDLNHDMKDTATQTASRADMLGTLEQRHGLQDCHASGTLEQHGDSNPESSPVLHGERCEGHGTLEQHGSGSLELHGREINRCKHGIDELRCFRCVRERQGLSPHLGVS